MKVISWNANCKFRDKFHLLKDFDIAVVQECEDPTRCSSTDYRSWAANSYWVGSLKQKGLGIFLDQSISAELITQHSTTQKFFLPLQLSNGCQILGVWAMNAENRKDGYIAQVHEYLDSHAHYFNWDKLIIVGDFNSNAQWDGKREFRNHGNLVKKLDGFGLQSLYHYQENEPHGNETSSTFYMYRHKEKPYHIDYVFVPKNTIQESNLEIGKAEEWLQHSDHVPLFANLKAPNAKQ